MTNKEKVSVISNYLNSLFPDAKCELFYTKDYELAIAVMLSAQTTDKKVNEVTKVLFNEYKNLHDLANADLRHIEEIIKYIGLYKTKAKNVIGIASILLEKYNGVLPSDKKLLQTLPGIGNKSAGVIRAEVFSIPDLAVDTHILRVSKRLGLANENDGPFDVEKKLKKLIKKDDWIKSHHQLIFFGRYFCKAISPNCKNCKIHDICRVKMKKFS